MAGDFTRKTAVLGFSAPLRGLVATYDVHLRLIGMVGGWLLASSNH